MGRITIEIDEDLLGRAERQREYLVRLSTRVDLEALASEDLWR